MDTFHRPTLSHAIKLALACGIALIGTAATAQTVYKCRDAAGRLTYSNAPCASAARASGGKGDAARGVEVLGRHGGGTLSVTGSGGARLGSSFGRGSGLKPPSGAAGGYWQCQ